MSTSTKPPPDPTATQPSPPPADRVQTRCRCGNVSVLTEDHGSSDSHGTGVYIVSITRGARNFVAWGEMGSVRLRKADSIFLLHASLDRIRVVCVFLHSFQIREELTAYRRTPAYHQRQSRRRDSTSGSAPRVRRVSNDFPKQGQQGSTDRDRDNVRVAEADVLSSASRGRRGSRSAGGDEEEDGERIVVCTVCDEDVVKAKVDVDGGKIKIVQVLEVLCEKRVSQRRVEGQVWFGWS